MGFDVVLLNIGLLVALSVPGYLLRKFKKIDEKAVKVLVTLLIFAAQPAMVAKSFLSLKFKSEYGINILIALTLFALVMLAVFGVACAIFRNQRASCGTLNKNCTGLASWGEVGAMGAQNEDANSQSISTKANNVKAMGAKQSLAKSADSATIDNRVYRFAAMFGNTGYLGLPFISVLFPDNNVMLLYTSLCIVLFNLMTWTLGVYIITGDKKQISFKKGLFKPVPIAAALTIPFFFINAITIPAPIIKFVDSFGNMTTTLSMVIMGARMAEMPVKELFTDKKVYITSSLRLLLAPLIAFLLLKLLRVNDTDLFNTLMVICMMPSAAATIIFAENFLGKSYNAIKAVLFTSLLSILTVPIIAYLTLI